MPPPHCNMSVRPQLCYLETEINLCRNQEVFFIKIVVSALRLLTLFKNRGGGGWISSIFGNCVSRAALQLCLVRALSVSPATLRNQSSTIAFLLWVKCVFKLTRKVKFPVALKYVDHTASVAAMMLMFILMPFHQLSMNTVCHTTTGAFYSCGTWTSSLVWTPVKGNICGSCGFKRIRSKHLFLFWLGSLSQVLLFAPIGCHAHPL